MGMGFAPTWLRQVSPLLHKTILTTAHSARDQLHNTRLFSAQKVWNYPLSPFELANGWPQLRAVLRW